MLYKNYKCIVRVVNIFIAYILLQMEMEKTQLLPNTMSGDRALATRNFNSAGKAVDKGKWYMSPATVNAYYSPKVKIAPKYFFKCIF